MTSGLTKLSPHLFCLADTCQVYVVRTGRRAVLVDFGSGAVLDALPALGVNEVTAVLMTHHHRDQGQGLDRAVLARIPIFVPHTEQDLFAQVEAHWQAREVFNNYNMRQDRFSLLAPVPIAGTLRDYAKYEFGGLSFTVLPTPGHTTGSISLWAEIDGRAVAFTGDLIAGPGQVWSLAATQWSYNGAEGVAASIPSLLDLKRREPECLLPSHGPAIAAPGPAIDLLVERLAELLTWRRQNPRLFPFMEAPFVALTPHLLRNRTSFAYYHVLVSASGQALVLDFGYDFATGIPFGSDRASRRPSLYSLPALERDFGVHGIDAVLPTHYHDDHVAGFNLLRQEYGAQVWAPENFSHILPDPARFDLPCLWYDPIPVDRMLPLETPIQWEEYTLTLHPLPGHTRYAVAISFEVDGKRVLVAGDQYQRDTGDDYNYVYQNRFDPGDYLQSAELYGRLKPDLILTGHWEPLWVRPDYFEQLVKMGAALQRLHLDLLAPDNKAQTAEGFGARLEPYQVTVTGGDTFQICLELHNPLAQTAEATVNLVTPPAWAVETMPQTVTLTPLGEARLLFRVTPPADLVVRRARIAAEVRLNDRDLGQVAEALISVT